MKKDYFFFYSFSSLTLGFGNGVTKIVDLYPEDLGTFPIREVEKYLTNQMGEKCVILYYKEISREEFNDHNKKR